MAEIDRDRERERTNKRGRHSVDFCLVNHNFAENREKEPGLAVGHGRSADVQVAAPKIILALDVDARLEEGVISSSDLAARRLHQ